MDVEITFLEYNKRISSPCLSCSNLKTCMSFKVRNGTKRPFEDWAVIWGANSYVRYRKCYVKIAEWGWDEDHILL